MPWKASARVWSSLLCLGPAVRYSSTVCLSFLCGCRSMILRLPMAFSMWQWEVFPRATDPSSSPIMTSASTVSQPKIDESIQNVLGVVKLFLFTLCTKEPHSGALQFELLYSHIMSMSFSWHLSRQVVLQHPVQLRGYAGDHAALCSGSRGRTWPAGRCTSLPQQVGVRLVLHSLMNGNAFISVRVEESQSIHLVRM